jgi:rubrerythrin
VPTRNEGPLTLETLDVDGALQETAHEARSVLSRRGLLASAGLAVGGVPVAFAMAQGGGLPKGDIKILNYALTLEYLEAAFYNEAVASGKYKGIVANFASTVAEHENAHVDALKAALGSNAVAKPEFDFKGTNTGDVKTFLATAKVLEDTGVSAYQGQADKIKTPAVLGSAGAILAVEARHAAWVRDIIGADDISPAPAAFNTAKSMTEVLDAVKGTGFIKS